MIRLGPFELESRAGRGAMATVWHAHHRESGTPVAVKIVTAPARRAADFRRLFGDEVRAMAGLDHPGIVGIYDHGVVPPDAPEELPAGAPFLVMEWLDGGPLRGRRGRLPWPTLRAVLLTLLDALAHAHARGVVHRDLKDANVMWSARGAVITDFGLALALDDGPVEGGLSGTPAFMAPEQIRCAWREIGPWTDLYALGCLTHALVSGRPPFVGRRPSDILRAHQADPPPPLEGRLAMPPGLGGWTDRLLAKSPARRFRRAADAAWALLALPDELPASVGGASTSTPPLAGAVVAERPRPTEPGTLPAPFADPPAEGSITAVGDLIGGENGEMTVTQRKADGESTLVAPPVFLAVDDGSWAAPAGAVPGPPPCPADWREPPRPLAPPPPAGLGQALFDLRPSMMSDRDEARGALWAALRAVTAGQGARCVVVDGGPGLGKTRLVDWLGERAHEVGAVDVLRAAFDGEDPHEGLRAMWIRHLRCGGLAGQERHRRIADALAIDADEPLARAMSAALDPHGRFASEGDTGAVSIATHAERWETFCLALARCVRRRPALVALDDAHHGPSTVGFVNHLLDRHPALPVLLVVTFDRLDDGPERAALLARPVTERIELGPLDADSITEMLSRRLPLDRSGALMLTEQSGGDPQLAEQIVRRWLSAGLLVEGRRGYRPVRRTPPPAPLQPADGWAERLERALGPRGGVSLEGAAALGLIVEETRWRAVVDRLLDVPRDDGRERLLDAGLARIDADGRLVFAHPRVREALLVRAATGGRLRRWHIACAAVLDREGDDPVAIARHLVSGGAEAAGLGRLLDVLEERRGRGELEAVADAVRLALRAVRHLGLGPAEPRRVRLRASWISHCLVEGRVDAARRHARRQLRLVAGDGAATARAELQYGRTLVDADAARAIGWFERARSSADEAGVARTAIEALAFIGFCRMLEGKLDAAEAALAEGVSRLAAAPGGEGPAAIPRAIRPAIGGRLHLYRAWTQWKRGHLEPAEHHARQALAAARRSGSRERQALAETTLGDLARHRKAWDEAEARYHAAERLLDAIGFDGPRDVDCYLALVAVERDRAFTAMRRLEATLARAERHRHVALEAFAAALLLSVAADTADSDLWARCWDRLGPLHAGRIADPDVARALRLAGDRAGRAGLAEQATAARRLAAGMYEALGWTTEAAQVGALVGG